MFYGVSIIEMWTNLFSCRAVYDLKAHASGDNDWLCSLFLRLDVLDVSLDDCAEVLQHLPPRLSLLHPLVAGVLQILEAGSDLTKLGAGRQTFDHSLGSDRLKLLQKNIIKFVNRNPFSYNRCLK